jgi:hypothetical protein
MYKMMKGVNTLEHFDNLVQNREKYSFKLIVSVMDSIRQHYNANSSDLLRLIHLDGDDLHRLTYFSGLGDFAEYVGPDHLLTLWNCCG